MSCSRRKKMARRLAQSEKMIEVLDEPEVIEAQEAPLVLIEPPIPTPDVILDAPDAPGDTKDPEEVAQEVPRKPVVKKKSYKQK